MSHKPIFVATHPRACSTAFERVFMTRADLTCVHEPFGDAFYFGPERLGERYEGDAKARKASGFEDSTYQTIFDRLEAEKKQGKRLFIKDITHYLVPPNGKPASIAPSLGGKVKKGVGTETNGDSASPPYPYNTLAEEGNPTVVPLETLKQFHWTFLIRHPRRSIPSYFRCTVPPLAEVTGFYDFMPAEAGYSELVAVFRYLKDQGLIGPMVGGNVAAASVTQNVEQGEEVSITVVDADDLLDAPAEIVEKYCREVGFEYSPKMLVWDDEENHAKAKEAFEKWKGFHDDAINSTSLKPRDPNHKHTKTEAQEYEEWTQKYGKAGADLIKSTVAQNVEDYEYLKSFAIKIGEGFLPGIGSGAQTGLKTVAEAAHSVARAVGLEAEAEVKT